jgi:uncharacterized protein (DUF1697 family)
MALVVLLRGVNVGGHKTFRPSILAKELAHLDVVNVGAAGTFVIRGCISQVDLRSEFQRRLPFDTLAIICKGSDIQELVAKDPFAGQPAKKDVVPFVSVLSGRSKTLEADLRLPEKGQWCLKVLARRKCFVIGMYRREMRAIRYLGQLDKLCGVPLTTRNWNTILAVAKVLRSG